MIAAGVILVLVTVAGFAQNVQEGASEFEVVSVKRMAPAAVVVPLGLNPSSLSPLAMGIPITKGGPGTSTPTRIHYENVGLMYLIVKAYDIHPDQVRGLGGLSSNKYMVDAVFHSGTTMEEFQQMLQNLLVQRFRLAFRWEEADFKVYRLILDDAGPRLRSSAVLDRSEDEDAPASVIARLKGSTLVDSRGCPDLPLTQHGAAGKIGAGNCATFVGYSMSELAATLEDYVGAETTGDFATTSPAHVIDVTGLKGRFDFHLNYNKMYFLMRAPGSPMPASMIDTIPSSDSIFKVVRNQVGLRLERTTSKLKVMMIQRLEANPGDN